MTVASDPDLPSPARSRALSLLTVTLVLSMSTWFSASAVIPQLRREWDLSTTSGAWLTIAVQVGFVIGAVISSVINLSDIFSPRLVILGGALGAALVNGLIALVDSPQLGIPLRLATGFFLAGVYPPAFKLLSTWFRKGRGLALGVLAGGIIIGNAMPHLVNGLGGLDWRIVIYTTSILTVVGGMITWFAVTEGPFPFPRATFDPAQAGRVLANRGVRLASFGYFGHMWELFAMYAWFLVFFSDALAAHGSSPGTAPAFATFAVIAAGSVGCWIGGLLGDHWGRTRTTAAMMAVSGTCSLLVGLLFAAPIWLLLAVGLIWGIAVVGDSPQFSTMVTELADQAYVGTALTIQLAGGFALTIPTIWLVPFLESAVGWRWAFALLAIGPAFGVWAMLRLRSLPEAKKIAGGLG